MEKLIENLQKCQESFWINPSVKSAKKELANAFISKKEIEEARARLNRFKPLFVSLFKETKSKAGIIESPFVAGIDFKKALERYKNTKIQGDVYLKLDSHLPISGSIKARGGIYEVLAHTERLLIKSKLLSYKDDYALINTPKIKDFLNRHKIAVGSTGNLGLSIGIMSAKLGFKVAVHMSADAREWKKAMLRSYGVEVVEYKEDYGVAVAQGRKQAQNDPSCHFIDDENSKDLFLGYSVAAKRLQGQLQALDIVVDKQNPLFVYLPCGVGGGPGGVAFGLKHIFGDNVKCFFAEPTHSPCMMLGLISKKLDKISVNDIGLDNKTAADGLAVGRPSALVSKILKNVIDGAFSISDDNMFRYLALLEQSEEIKLEPSALAGVNGLFYADEFVSKAKQNYKNITHIIWATGGAMVPKQEMQAYIERGKSLL